MKPMKALVTIFGLVTTTLILSSCMKQADAFFHTPPPCPAQAITDMNAEFGAGTSDLTSCAENRTAILEVVAWNSSALNKRSGAGQQPHSTNNMVKNYINMYGMTAGSDFEVVAVGFSGGARWLLNDEAYNRTYNTNTGNPSRTVIESLLANGAHIVMCQNTMRSNGWVTTDLAPGVTMVPAGAVTVVDLQESGYSYISP